MIDTQVLAALRDIQLPEPISWWPMALGWYILISLFLLGSFLMTYGLRRYTHNRAKREALKLLASYHHDYLKEADAHYSSMQVAELLRRVALAYFPRERVAGLQDETWLIFLSDTAKGIQVDLIRDALLKAPFQKDTNVDLNPLFLYAKAWIKQRRRPPCLS